MAGKLDTRVARSYTFTFDTLEEKQEALAHAKQQGTNLANLIKMLLTSELKKAPAKPKS